MGRSKHQGNLGISSGYICFPSSSPIMSWNYMRAGLWKHIPMVWQVDEGWLVRDGSSKARWHGEIRAEIARSFVAPSHMHLIFAHFARIRSSNIPNDIQWLQMSYLHYICWVTLNNKWYPSEDWCQQFQRNWKMHAINIPQPGWGRSWHGNGDRQRMKEKEQKNDVDTCRHGMMDPGNWRNMKDRSAVCPPLPRRGGRTISLMLFYCRVQCSYTPKGHGSIDKYWQGIDKEL